LWIYGNLNHNYENKGVFVFTFLSNIFKKQARNLCFTPLLLCMTHNDLPTKWIFIKESARWSGIHYYNTYDMARITRWPVQDITLLISTSHFKKISLIIDMNTKGCCHSFKVNSGFCKACMFIPVQIFKQCYKLHRGVMLWL
jgi:hypothetical protein